MKWRERILRWVAELHGAVIVAVLLALAFVMVDVDEWGPEGRFSVGVWILLVVLFAAAWQLLLTAAAHGLCGIGWREAGGRMAKSFGRGALLLAVAYLAIGAIIGIEADLQPMLGIRAWY